MHWDQSKTANIVIDTVLYELDYIIKIIDNITNISFYNIQTMDSGREDSKHD